MKILYVVQTFPPEPGATKRPARQAAAWVRAGHDVTVVTALPSYPLGHRLPGYRGRMFVRERVDGVEVLRVPTFTSPNVGFVRRTLSFASFAAAATLSGSRVERPDVIIGSMFKPGTELAALTLARVHGCPLLLEVRDVLPRNLVRGQFLSPTPAVALLDSLYGAIYRRAQKLAVTEQAAAAMLVELGVRPEHIVSWPHAWDSSDLADDEAGARVRNDLGWTDAFVVTYAGSFSALYRILDMVEAARRLQRRLPNLRLLLVGTGATFDQVRRAAEGLSNVHMTGGIEPGAVGPWLRAADMFLLPAVNDDPLGGTKIVEYLAIGRPVLALEVRPGAGLALANIGAGEGVSIDDPNALDRALIEWANAPARRREAAANARAYAAPLERTHVAAAALDDVRELVRAANP